jgi:hypothetical protein
MNIAIAPANSSAPMMYIPVLPRPMAWKPATFWASALSLPNAENAYTAASSTCSVQRATVAARERVRRGAAAVVAVGNVVIVVSRCALWRAFTRGDRLPAHNSSVVAR